MNRTTRVAWTTVGVLILGLLPGVQAMVATPTSPALTGTVTSQPEGTMEGVIIGARKTGATMTTWVVSDADGHYAFPRERLAPGHYTLKIRAVGYTLPDTVIEVKTYPVSRDLRLDKVTDKMDLARQLSNTEWFLSMPGTHAQKNLLGGCTTCHTLQRILFSKHDAKEMVNVVRRMHTHTNNSSSAHPWTIPPGTLPPPTKKDRAIARYVSSINLSTTGTFNFPLKTLPRPAGKATRVIYTTYDLPRPDAAPHDVELDAYGNAWYADFTTQYIGKLDIATGKVTDYPVPLGRQGPNARGGLQIALDKQGLVYYGNMFQMQFVRLDPETGKMQEFKPPIPESQYGHGHITMIDPWFRDVDGWIWLNVARGTDESGGTWHVNPSTNTWQQVSYPEGSPSARAYDVIANSDNDMYGMHMRNPRIWMTDGKTLKTTWYDFPAGGKGCRRGHLDNRDRVWCADFNGNRLAMFDPETKKVTEWNVPTPWVRPYDAEFDDSTYDWGAGMDGDLAERMNTKTGEFTEYLLPHETNVRHVEVQKSAGLSSFWLGDQHGASVIHIEPLTP